MLKCETGKIVNSVDWLKPCIGTWMLGVLLTRLIIEINKH